MGGKKGGGSAHVPYEAPNTLYSKQRVKVLDVLSEGPVEGLSNGNAHPFKSLFFNDTPVQAKDGSFNFFGFNLAMTTGEKDQTYLPGFDVVEKTNQVNADLKKDTPITRSVTDPNVSGVRVTVGVKGLVQSKDNGDRVATSVSMQVSLLKNGNIHSSQHITINEKGTESFYQDVKFNDLPEAPFDIRVSRLTEDSKSDKLQNATIFPSYVEIIDAKLSYKHLSVAGYEFDAQQFGSSLPRINTLMKLLIVSVPTNYDPINRTYVGMWDGSFKKAWSDNPAWAIYDFATNKRYGGALDPRYVNRAALYRLSQFCDELVDDGYGGKEPRITFNAFYTNGKKFEERLQDMASACFGLAHWDGQYLTFSLDRDDDPVAVYTNANVIGGNFSYEGISHNAIVTDVHVQYNDSKDAYRQKIEVVEDIDLLRRYPRNTKKVVAEGCTSRSQAHRMGRYILEKSRLQSLISFAVGREGLRHRPHDVIQIADIHAAGANIGGRILEVNGKEVTLDREVEKTNNAIFSYVGEVDGKLSRVETKVVSQKDDYTLVLEEVTDDLEKFTVFNLARTDVKPKYYRALGISDNGDGTYSIKAVEHEMGLQDRIASGIKFEDNPNSIWASYPEITNGTVGNNGDEVVITWDNINADTTALTYTVKLFKDGKLYRTYPDLREPVMKFDNLPSGAYVAEIHAKNSRGQLSNILKQYFDLNFTITALETTPELFAVKLNWQLPTIANTSISTEIWRAEKDDINEARLLVTLPYPQSEYLDSGKSATDSYYYWVRIIDKNGRTGEFTRSMRGEPKTDPSDITDILDEAIGEKQISKDLKDQFDSNIDDKVEKAKEEIKSEIDGIEIDLTGINSEIDNIKTDITKIDSELVGINADIAIIDSDIDSVKESAEKALSDAENNAQAIKEQSTVIDSVSKKQGEAEANWQLAQMSNVSAHKSEFARSMSMSAQVAQSIAKIEEIDSFVVTEKEATATRFTQINTRVDSAESKITSVETSLASDIKAEASKREALEAVFDLSKAQQQLQLMTQATADKSLSSRLFSMSASTANAHAKYDELQEVVATNEDARVTSEQKLQAEIDSSKADITRIDRVMTSEFSSQATSIRDLSSELDDAKADIKTAEQAIVNNEKSQSKRNEEFNAQFGENEAKHQLSLLTESSNTRSLSQRYLSLSAQTANSSAKIERLEKVFADSETSWAVTEERLQSQIDNSKSEISRIEKVSNDRDSAQSVVNESVKSELDTAKAGIDRAEKTIADNEKAQAKIDQQLASKIDGNSASQQLQLITQSSNDASLSHRYFSLSAQTANSSAKIESLEKVFADSEVAWAVTEHHLQSQLDSSKSEISRIDKTVTDNEKSQAQAMSSLSSELDTAKSDIKNVEKAQSDAEKSLTSQINSVSSEWKEASRVKYLTGEVKEKTPAEYLSEYGITTVTELGSRAWFGIDQGTYHTVETTISFGNGLDRGRVTQRASSNDFIKVIVRERKSTSDETWSPWIILEDTSGSQAKADAAQQEAIKVSKASINSYATTQAAANKAFTEQINSANSEIGKNKASITQISSTQATTDGKVNAMYTLKVDAKGNIGGIMLGANEHESMFKVAADTFVVSTPDQTVNMFSLQQVNGKTVAAINGDLIAKGSISGDKITANTSIASPIIKGGRVESGHFAGGSINIGNGNFSVDSNGNLIAKSGTFEGTVFAKKIKGGIVDLVQFRDIRIDRSDIDARRGARFYLTADDVDYIYTIKPFLIRVSNGDIGVAVVRDDGVLIGRGETSSGYWQAGEHLINEFSEVDIYVEKNSTRYVDINLWYSGSRGSYAHIVGVNFQRIMRTELPIIETPVKNNGL